MRSIRCKKAIALLFIICISLSLVACGEVKSSDNGNRTVARILGYDVAAEWLEYKTKLQQNLGSETPSDDALESIKYNLRNQYIVETCIENYDEEYFDMLMQDYVNTQLAQVERVSAAYEQQFLETSGITLDEWKSHFLPEYDAPAAIYSEFAAALVTELDDELNMENLEIEILDEEFLKLMDEKYPCTRDLSRVFIDELLPGFEAELDASDTEVYSWYRYDDGRKAIVYGKTCIDGRFLEGEVYLEQNKGVWEIQDRKVFLGMETEKDNWSMLELMTSGDENEMDAYYAANLHLFPELHESNEGTIFVTETGGACTVTLKMTVGRYSSTGAMEGPQIMFTVDLSDPDQPAVREKTLTDKHEYVGENEASREHSHSYYVIPDERMIQMAEALYAYVPQNALK